MKTNSTTKVLHTFILCIGLCFAVQAQYITIQPSEPIDFWQALSLENDGLIYYDDKSKTLQLWDGTQWHRVGKDIMTQAEINAITPYEGMKLYNINEGVVQQWQSGGWVQKTQDIIVVQESEVTEISPADLYDGMLIFNRAEGSLKVWRADVNDWRAFGNDNMGDHTAVENIRVNGKWITPDTTKIGTPALGGIYVAPNGLIGIGHGFGSPSLANRTAPPSGRTTPSPNNANAQRQNSASNADSASGSANRQDMKKGDVLLENVANGIIMRDQLTGEMRRVVLRGGVLVVE